MSVVLVVFVFICPKLETRVDSTTLVGVWRRFGAFYLDFLTVLMALVPLAALPLLIAESQYTGEFHWSFSRQFSRSTDTILLLPSTLFIFVALFWYFYWHAQSGKQTLGQYILGYKVMGDVESKKRPRYALRVVLSFLGLSMWPISVIFALRKSNKVFWWDTASSTMAVRVSAVNNTLERTDER